MSSSDGASTAAVSAVLHAIGRLAPVMRQDLVRDTGLSAATVARAVTSLADAGLIRERPDLLPAGTPGRPSIPVEPDDRQYMVLGLHVGQRLTTIALARMDGRVLVSTRQPTLRSTDGGFPVETVVGRLGNLVARFAPARVLALGVAGPWSDLPWDPDHVRNDLRRAIGLPVVVADHVAAIAGADVLDGSERPAGSTLYFYARETMGFVLAVDGRLPDDGKVGRLTHLPTGSTARCDCGAVGCLGATAGDRSVIRRAQQAGLVAEPSMAAVVACADDGDGAALELLRERARVLGRAVAVVRDMLCPDRIVLAGQAFTAFPRTFADLVAAFQSATALPAMEPTFAWMGAGVQAIAATSCALRHVYADPLTIIRQRNPNHLFGAGRGGVGLPNPSLSSRHRRLSA